MKLQKPLNANYCATVVALKDFVTLPKCDNVKAALIFGNSVIVGKEAQAGDIGLFFPVETALNEKFLWANNLYRDATKNIDPTVKGYFENHGRIKAVKFRGNKSEGFWIPLDSLHCMRMVVEDSVRWDVDSLSVGNEFDLLGTQEICHKYVPKQNPMGTHKKQGHMPKMEDQIVAGQFHFHIDTENLRRNIHKFIPYDWISISDKWHGTSAIVSNILVNRKLSLVEKFLKWTGIANVQETEYKIVWASRRVVKGVGEEAKTSAIHFYDSDIWGIVKEEVKEKIPKGFTVYGEIVGFLPNGGHIQKGYDYGCVQDTHRFMVYRVTFTNADGKVTELSWNAIQEFCDKYAFEMVKTFWFGRACDFAPMLGSIGFNEDDSYDDWRARFLAKLEKEYIKEQLCPECSGTVPQEGIVVRVDRLDSVESYKLKNFRFLEWESKQLDTGEVDMESQVDESVS